MAVDMKNINKSKTICIDDCGVVRGAVVRSVERKGDGHEIKADTSRGPMTLYFPIDIIYQMWDRDDI